MTLLPLPAFSDNYIWFLHDGHNALVVDPGDAQPVLDALAQLKLNLQTILVTHHHADHVGGVDTLRDATGSKVYGPAFETIPEPVSRLSAGDAAQALGCTFKVSDVPGHTSGHIAYFCDNVVIDGRSAPLLFCGDTLFSGGCGRLFEGTPAQMLASLGSFAVLPGNTRVCATHEYTLSNLRFARAVEPGNLDLQAYEASCVALRAAQQPTLPSTIAQELLINPFLRTHCAPVINAMTARDATLDSDDPVAVFAAVREWKNRF